LPSEHTVTTAYIAAAVVTVAATMLNAPFHALTTYMICKPSIPTHGEVHLAE
jgi:hypothetical protein